jgi:hypothetical protein
VYHSHENRFAWTRTDMFCQQCGAKIPDGHGICTHCSAVNAPQQPVRIVLAPASASNSLPTVPTVKVGKLIASLVSLGFAIWVMYQAGIFGSTERAEDAVPTLRAMHQTFSVGYWRYSVDRVFASYSLGQGLSAEKANGRFVIVYLTAANNDRGASILPSPVLKDSRDREHSSKPVIGSGLRGQDLTITTLNPGVSTQGYFVFDVPTDASSLEIVLSGGFRSKERAAVPLGSD